MFTENFICRCKRNEGFRYSAEIIATNKAKCFFCGREVKVPASLEPPYIDRYKGGSGGLGGWDGKVSSFQKSAQKSRPVRKPERKPEQEVLEIEKEKPEVDYISEGKDHIVIKFPYHNSLNQIRCEIVDGFLEVQSRLVDFLEKFPLPDFPVELETSFKNAILEIRLKKRK